MVWDIFRTDVFNPANEKLHPPLLIIGLGRLNLFGFPFFDYFSIFGHGGNDKSIIF